MSDRAPDEMDVLAELVIRQHRNGALSVAGPVDDAEWCLAALDHAKDAVRSRRANLDKLLIVPAKDVSIP